MKPIRVVERADVLAALAVVEAQCGAEIANLLRAVYDGLSFIASDASVAYDSVLFELDEKPADKGWYAGR